MLLDGGILVVPALLTNLDGAQSWGVLADQVLGLRVEEEEALRKVKKAACFESVLFLL